MSNHVQMPQCFGRFPLDTGGNQECDWCGVRARCKVMGEGNLNPWDKQYLIRAFDVVKGEWRDFGLMEFTEEDFRKWVCWKLEQIQNTLISHLR